MALTYNPREKYKKIGIIALAAIFLGWMIYQQMTLNALRKILTPTENVAGSEKGLNNAGKNVLSDETVERAKESLIANTTDFTGKIVSISGNILGVETEIVDLEKIKNATADDEKTFSKMKKTIIVTTNDKTEFLSKKLAEIREGDSIKIYTNDAIYTLDNVAATKIVSPVVAMGDTASQGGKFIVGKVEKIENKVMTVSVISKGSKVAGSFNVQIGPGTKILKRELSNPPKDSEINVGSIGPGGNVTALAADPIGGKKEFEATEVILMIPPPK